ncbi:tetratricopeptide repeat protein [Pseudomonas sp. Pseusp122]|uniref:tetratricopeptide repeat protein n=1 Tax=unclassified Pseudomonas TaxID=196821 RepID=UPI0039A78111
MTYDYLGNPLDTERPTTVTAINDFIGGFLAYDPRALTIIAAADADADSALANVFAGLLMMFSESPEGPELAAIYQLRAEAAQPPEASRAGLYLQLLRAWRLEDLPRAITLSENLATTFSRDLLAVKLAQYFYFNSGNWPAMLRVAVQAAEHAADVAHTHGMLAFAYEQCHLLDQAENAARQALHLLPSEPWAQHALAHVMLTQGRIEEGTAFFEEVSDGWDGLNSFMYTHNWWHLALFHLARGRHARVLEIYDRHVWGILPEYSQDQIGAVSLLTRMELAGIDVGERWQALGKYLLARVADAVQPFLSLQYLYGLARAGHRDAAAQLLQALDEQAKAAPSYSRGVWRDITLPVAHGLLAHARQDYPSAASLLGDTLPALNAIGGSHAQRDLFALIELDARVRAGDWQVAQQTLELRRRYDPWDVPTNQSLERVYAALHLPGEARRAAGRVTQALSGVIPA